MEYIEAMAVACAIERRVAIRHCLNGSGGRFLESEGQTTQPFKQWHASSAAQPEDHGIISRTTFALCAASPHRRRSAVCDWG